MEVRNQKLAQLLGATGQFFIPVFQRDYSWKAKRHCAQLWDDVVRAGSKAREHFLGAIVCSPAEDLATGFPRWQVIDGQQRLTTLTLLFTAMRDYLLETERKEVNGITAARIEDEYLTNRHERKHHRYRLLLRRHDRDALCRLVDNKKPFPEGVSAAIEAAYSHFRQELRTANFAEVWRGIQSLRIVEVTLRGDDDAQAIFESLNATGLALNKSDLIRNCILMGLQEEEQTAMYNEYWIVIEKLFRNENDRVFDNFARDYLDLKRRKEAQTRRESIYPEFQSFWDNREEGLDSALKDMVRHARYYAAVLIGPGETPAREERYRGIRQLRAAPAITAMRLLACLENSADFDEPDFGERDFLEALDLIESYLVRRSVCGESTRGYDTVFAVLTSKIGNRRPLLDLKTAFRLLPPGQGFPSNDAFLHALRDRKVYGLRVCKLILDRLENHNTKEPSYTGGYTIEHILPQNPKLISQWTDMLGPDWQEVQETWVHRLGNLTLTGYNKEYSDRSFSEKKTMAGGFRQSAVRLNSFVADQARWTATEIEERTNLLAERALSIWPPLEVDQSVVDLAKVRERLQRAEAAGRTVAKIAMTPPIRRLFGELQQGIVKLGGDVTVIPEPKSVSYHRTRYFSEIVPQKNRLQLLLALEFDQIEDPPKRAKELRSRVIGSQHTEDSGTLCSITDRTSMVEALPLIRQAHSAAG